MASGLGASGAPWPGAHSTKLSLGCAHWGPRWPYMQLPRCRGAARVWGRKLGRVAFLLSSGRLCLSVELVAICRQSPGTSCLSGQA